MTEIDPIETLLKATGRRPAVSVDRTDRVREVVHAHWRSEMARCARRRRIGWVLSMASAAAAVAVVGLGIHMLRSPSPPEPSGVSVERVWNVAQLSVGSILPRNLAITTGPDARVALRAATGHSVRLDFDTTLTVRAGGVFALQQGAVYVDSERGDASSIASITIETPIAAIEDKGTQFEARLAGEALSVRVREGVVTVQRRDERFVANAGQSLRLEASGEPILSEDDGTGASWEWVTAIAPMMEIEGKSLREFLDWIARERGVRVRFEDAQLAEKAPNIMLNGSIAGMTLEQATTSVLATSGLSHRWERDALIVGARK